MTVMVTGGAGYVGAHMLLALGEAKTPALAVDNLSHGAEWLIPPSAAFAHCDVGDEARIAGLIREHGVRDVIHFAGSTLVPESLERPLDYYENNTARTIALLKVCVAEGVERFIFSSTAAVYGTPEVTPVNETAPIHSISPYGGSMAMSERVVEDAARAHDFRFVTLRYFNVAGADPEGRAGQIGKPTHLVRVAAQIAVGARNEALRVFGDDYPTPDGTAIRDYVHVSDLAEAHLKALTYLQRGGASRILNCGYGRGYSVREVVDAVERVSGETIELESAPRRPGDPAQLIADSAAIRSILGWRPRFDDIDFIVETALAWERRRLSVAG